MNRTELAGSSNLKSIGYDESSRIVEVEFQNGRIYQYYDVPLEIYRLFWRLPDKGSYFKSVIKAGYRYAEIK
jgi:hypothetical protein